MKHLIFIVLILNAMTAHGEQCSEVPATLCEPAVKALQSVVLSKEDQLEFMRGYRFGYLQYLIDDGSLMSVKPEKSPFVLGFHAAMQYSKNSGKQNAIVNIGLDSFGYKPIEGVGKFTLGFEMNYFTPENGEPSWCQRFPKAVRKKYSKIIDDKRLLKIKGWLSPIGLYGHMGSCQYEVVINELSELK